MITELVVIYGCEWNEDLESLRQEIIKTPDHKLKDLLNEDKFFKEWTLSLGPNEEVYGYIGRSFKLLEEGDSFNEKDLKIPKDIESSIKELVKDSIESQPPEVQDLLEEPSVKVIWSWY